MTPFTDNNFPEQRSTGSLEDLFRQKFAEAEVAPRADLWERLDNDLLVRQNEGYRRRLGVWRWAAAAACAVASLSGGAWLMQQDRTATKSAADAPLAAASTLRDALVEPAKSGAANQAVAATNATEEDAAVSQGLTATSNAAAQPRRNVTSNRTVTAPRYGTAASASSVAAASQQSADKSGLGLTAGVREGIRSFFGEAAGSSGATTTATTATTAAAGNRAGASATDAAAFAGQLSEEASMLQPIASVLHGGSNDARPDSLKAALLQVPTLAAAEVPAAQEEDEKPAEAAAKAWRWRTGYTASRFAPNINTVAAMGSAGGFSADSRTQSFTTKTKPVLNPGLAQRGQVGGSWQFAERWSLVTAAELTVAAGNTVVEEAPARLYPYGVPMVANRVPSQQEARYHFTTASVPVQLRYSGRKSGWSLYGAVGAAVNVLLRNRLEVDGEPVTDDVPYRRTLASVRGDVGLQFASAKAPWKFMIGPEAEVGLNSMNSNATGTWLERTKPYSIGLAASMEFGSRKADVVQP
ncbi:hypothetical protein [Hymenobacter koreensis]|uniref:Outer membrane protein beta-barrel domain-containing protein n=1 Tax=Hymenobacter koreensis TaxID=1084523 RepID=A0ABP8IX50_9BACT